MRYFALRTMGATNDSSLCILNRPPEGLGRKDHCITLGKRVGDQWPDDARMVMDPDTPGIKMETVIGTSCAWLVCHVDMVTVLRAVCRNDIEYLAIRIDNHRAKPASSDYVVVNVIGTIDCLDEKASQVRKTPKGTIVSMKTPTIDARRMPLDLHLFRPVSAPQRIFMSEVLGRALAKRKFTNVVFDEVQTITG